MPFSNTVYEADNGDIHPLRIAPETLAAAGTAPTGAVTNSIRPKISKSNREFGISPRMVTGSRLRGTAPDQFLEYVSIPVLTPSSFAMAAFQLNGTFDYNGNTFTIISRTPEDIN